ncbi:Tetracycline resistance protein from transposon [Colletotrichum higginsianum]|uniref:Tetracycline resistance protein from transposon n=1 Tax=Colletotrichum higginsianum TaxID=80884 RepID=A0A4T0W8B9_9PEZI|nr:Tetracycline resistance protein from transposon [Colletotrichum higginsianum]
MATTQVRSTTASVAIIGAGPCGLTFARLLEQNNIDYVVFERDANSTPTPLYQGGTLDLHANSGQQAIKRAGLFEEFKKLARWDATRLVIQNPECTLKKSFGEERDAPEIDRFQLRQLLLDSIPSHRVRWGHGMQSIERDPNSSPEAPLWVVNFNNSTCASGFQLVVGADGAWSKVRPLLTSAKPEYSGKLFIEGRITHGNPSYAAALELVGPGNMGAWGHGRSLMVQQVADRSYRVYMGLEGPENLTSTVLDVADTEATRHKLLSSPEFFSSHAPELLQFIAEAEGPFRPWPLYRMPVSSLNWAHVSGVALLGDAAHVSTPFVGEGVNLAMHDALRLADSIEKHCRRDSEDKMHLGFAQLEKALVEYETDMLLRAQDYISRCILMETLFFADDAAQQLIDLLTDAVEKQQEQLLVGEK